MTDAPYEDDDGVGVSVFAGIGGLEHGFEAAGVPTAVQIEWDAQARKVLAERYPDAVRFGDVREVTVDAVRAVLGDRRVRCLYGGFPCQDVSVAGRRAGMAGERSSLYTELVRLADGLDPRWLVVENVPGLLSADVDPDANGGKECADAGGGCAHPVRPETGTAHGYGRGTAFAVVLGDITGYRPPVPDGGWRNSGVCSGPRRTVAWRVLDARHFGVAQRRRRVFLVACAGDRAAPAAVLLEPEGVRGDPPPGEPPRPRFATRAARPAVRAGAARADGAGADGAAPGPRRGLTADEGVTTALSASLGGVGADAAHAQAGWLVPTEPLAADARNGAVSADVTGTLQSHGQSYSLNAQPTVVQPNDEVGALTASGGPSALDDQSTSQLVVGADTYNGTLTGDVAHTLREGGGFSAGGDEVPRVIVGGDPARPVAIRGRDGGAQAELGDEPLSNALRAGDGGSSRQTTILAYEVDKERGVRNDEGVKVTETDVAPPLLADGDPAERTDRGLRVVQPFRKSRRAQDNTDDETWVEGDVANTLNTFDGGDVRASEVVVETDVVATGFYPTGGAQGMGDGREVAPPLKVGTSDGGPAPGAVAFSNAGYGAHVSDVAPTLQATGQEGNQVTGVIAPDIAATLTAGTSSDGVSPPGRRREDDENLVAFPIGQDALRGGAGEAATPSPDAEGRVRMRDPGLGVYDDGDPAATVTSTGPGAVGAVGTVHAQVRRLTPLECERLQGAADGWTDVDGAADSVRYRQLGNAVCFAVSDWLGWRVAAYDDGWRPA